jgi:hypothetical protein
MLPRQRRRRLLAIGIAACFLFVSPMGSPGPANTAAASSYVSCTGGTSFPNSLSAQWSWDGSSWQIHLDGKVTPWLLDSSLTVQVYVYTASGRSANVGTAGSDGVHYVWAYPVTQDYLGLFAAGDTSTFWLHFAIPAQPDRDTCTLSAAYSAPILPPTPRPTVPPVPTPAPVVTRRPAPTANATDAPTLPPAPSSGPVVSREPTATNEPASTDMNTPTDGSVAILERGASPSPLAGSVPASSPTGDSGSTNLVIAGLAIGLAFFAGVAGVLLWERRRT